jgi:hypothetical protein
MTARWLRNASAAAFLCAAFFPPLAVAQQQPPGPTLEFTLNYINQALAQRGDCTIPSVSCTQVSASVSLSGAYLTYTQTELFPTIGEDTIDSWMTINLTLVQGAPYVMQANQPHPTFSGGQPVGIPCPGTSCVTSNGGPLGYMTLEIDPTGNAYRAQDVVNALSHLIALVKAQSAAQQQQQQQQNQSDPFATPQ